MNTENNSNQPDATKSNEEKLDSSPSLKASKNNDSDFNKNFDEVFKEIVKEEKEIEVRRDKKSKKLLRDFASQQEIEEEKEKKLRLKQKTARSQLKEEKKRLKKNKHLSKADKKKAKSKIQEQVKNLKTSQAPHLDQEPKKVKKKQGFRATYRDNLQEVEAKHAAKKVASKALDKEAKPKVRIRIKNYFYGVGRELMRVSYINRKDLRSDSSIIFSVIIFFVIFLFLVDVVFIILKVIGLI